MELFSAFAGHYNFAITIFLMVAGLYIVVSRGNLVKKLVGLAIFQTSVYLLYIEPGKILGGTAPILDPALVGRTVAQSLGVQESGDRPLVEQLATALRGADLLLLLDNFEHVLGAAPFVADLLAACPRLAVLATSRERLRVGGEREFPVQPLPLPERLREPTARTLGENAAVRLFADRARAVDPTFALTDENAASRAF